MTSNSDQSAATRILGLQFVLVGLAVNHWSLAWKFSSNEAIEGFRHLYMIWAFQGVCVLIGLTLMIQQRFPKILAALQKPAALALVAVWGVGMFGTLRALGIVMPAAERQMQREIERMTASESVHLKIFPRFKKLSRSAADLRIPSAAGVALFTEEVEFVDLAAVQSHSQQYALETVDTQSVTWQVDPTVKNVSREDLSLMVALTDQVDYFANSKFYFVGGDFNDENMTKWVVEAGFTGLARMKAGHWAQVKSHLTVGWTRSEDDDLNDAESWSIESFHVDEMHTIESPQIFFSEELDRAVPDALALVEARRNRAHEMIVEKLVAEKDEGKWDAPHEFWSHLAAWRHPSVSVVDLNSDGFDDFYSMARYGTNQFFLNQGDGTFTEIGAKLGLDVEDHSDMALFADFDNDGDADLFLGRTIARSKFFSNEGGLFVERADALGQELPFFAVTASAADYDLDGMLDFYIGTYAAQLPGKDKNRVGRTPGTFLEDYLPGEQSRELFSLWFTGQSHRVRDRVGPPNVLARNTGAGGFEVDGSSTLAIYRNSFQSTFADYDEDGDPDVYVANDFAPNYMFRNEGDGKYSNQTDDSRAADIGFGMGVSWGDYDGDGDQDVYVSNMYSKAGRRITGRVSGMDGRFGEMARGNSLLKLEEGRFDRVSSLDDSGLMVELAGWSWGSQFLDVDNDSWLDLFALSGHYSAPRAFDLEVDL